MSPEYRLDRGLVHPADRAVVLAVRADVEPAFRPEVGALLGSGDVDPYEVWARAERHQVLPAVARLIASPELGGLLDPELVGAAQAYRRRVLAVNLYRHGELRTIVQAMHLAGIPAVPLKGTYLAERYYGGLDGRLSGDIDVLVPAERLAHARRVLAELGFQPLPETSPGRAFHPFHDRAYVCPGSRAVVELHWGLTDPRFVKVNYGRLWSRVKDSSGAGPNWPLVLPPEEELLFLSVHLPKHDTGLLRLLADVDRAVRHHGPGLDWAALVHLAVDWQATVMLYYGLERARLFFGTPVPEPVLARLRPAAWRRFAVDWLAAPEAVLAGPDPSNVRANRFRLAYCVMVTPWGKTIEACSAYFGRDPGLRGMLRGIGRLAVAILGSVSARQIRRRILTITQPVLNGPTTGPR